MAQVTTPKAPYTLVEVDASSVVTPLALSWHNLTVADGSSPAGPAAASPTKEPTTPKPNADEPLASAPSQKLVLDGVSGEAQPGKLLALLAPSRGVASALLDAIAQRTPPAAVLDGFVRVNHQPIRMTPTTTAFVPRQDALCPTLTVQEHLQLQARLRLDDQASPEERASRVAEVLAAVGLAGEVTQTRTGDVAGTGVGLSLLQRKLLAIATELLPNPSIVLLDEPTAGLDPFEAEAVISRLQSLARAGHTVVAAMSLTQPTSAMFQLFDQLHVFTSEGITVFRGKPTDSLAFFEDAGVACPPLTNPFEFFARTLCVRDADAATPIQRLANVWAAHEGSAGGVLKTPILEGSIVPSELYAPPVFPRSAVSTQLSVLLRRSGLRLVRDVATLRMRFARALVLALVVGLIFLRLDISQTTVQSLSSACFFMVATQFIANALPELSSMPLEVGVVLRDHSNRLYHALSWYAVKNLSELPFQLALPLVFLAPAFFLVGFPADAEIFFTFYFFIALVVSTGVAIALFASTVAPKPMLAFVLGLALLAPAIIFGGAFVNRKSTPVYFLWLQQLSPVKYGFHGVMRAFWSHVDAIPCPPDAICRARSGADVLATNIIHADKFASDWQILLAINLTLRVLGGLALWRRAAAARATATAPRK